VKVRASEGSVSLRVDSYSFVTWHPSSDLQMTYTARVSVCLTEMRADGEDSE